jgi:hypothetical protein
VVDDPRSIGSLVWYSEAKQLSLAKIQEFVPPANGREMRIYHGLYLTNLFAMIEAAPALCGELVIDSWRSALDGLGDQSGENNYCYLRELRNATVHRGMDITAAGIVVEGQVCALAPLEINDRHSKRGPFRRFDPLLRNMLAACEQAIATAVAPLAMVSIDQIDPPSEEDVQAAFDRAIDSAEHMPDWAKRTARKHFPTIDFDEVYAQQISKLKSLLTAGAPAGLMIAYP